MHVYASPLALETTSNPQESALESVAAPAPISTSSLEPSQVFDGKAKSPMPQVEVSEAEVEVALALSDVTSNQLTHLEDSASISTPISTIASSDLYVANTPNDVFSNDVSDQSVISDVPDVFGVDDDSIPSAADISEDGGLSFNQALDMCQIQFFDNRLIDPSSYPMKRDVYEGFLYDCLVQNSLERQARYFLGDR